jgi:endopeptidase La
MSNNQNKYNLFKINLLQTKYKYISDIIFKLTNHILFLDSYYLLNNDKKNEVLSQLYNINKNVNTIYNDNINAIDKNKESNYFSDFINSTKETSFDLLLSHSDILVKEIPFNKELNEIIELMNLVGNRSIKDLLKMNNYKIEDSELDNLINEIDNYFIPLSINTYNSTNSTDYYWRNPSKFNEEDILELTKELWILKSTNEDHSIYFKIEGLFTTDILSLKLKTSQINSNYIYSKKISIIKEISENNTDININFIKHFIKYDYIGNLYCLTVDSYITYLLNSYKLYQQLVKSSFVNIMKNFINNGSKLNNLYFIIFLLLLGNDDNAEVASLLINLTKEKKINSINLFNLIHKNLPYYMQLKIKKGYNMIKNELEKLKSLSIESIDYKKQLLSIKNISDNVKTLTLEKIEEMKSQNNEYYKQKTYVDNILKYPWSSVNDNNFDNLKNSDEIISYLHNLDNNLNKLTYGHDEAKKILLQTIAKWISNPLSGGKPLGFVGPPGVGKTLLAKSISRALKIPFAEITLGGQNDGELLHGHGYTYSGSQPGLIIKKMVEMGKERCILFFDELDKTASKHGNNNEISSILIHLTDPNMNKSFQDRFFQGIDFPLDKVIMIFSYNDSDKIDPILLDRLTEIKIKPYTLLDKVNIIRDYIIPELKLNINLKIDDDIIQYIVENYTNEAGLRDIKRQIEKIFLTLNLEILTKKININNYNLTIEEVNRILLKPKNENMKIHLKPEVGIINGLYATTNGDGGIIPIQIFNNFTSTSFEIKLTGKQGDVMKESVQCSLTCAMNYIKTNMNKYNITNFNEYFTDNFKNGFHIHAPSTSTPKDGPSAGIAFTCAFISRILNKPINNTVGMTGEIELTGKITKIGGLNFKLIGAKKAGVTQIYIPLENKDDLDEIKEKYPLLINDNFKVNMVEYIEEVIDKILI